MIGLVVVAYLIAEYDAELSDETIAEIIDARIR